jgi:hypothetical protein
MQERLVHPRSGRDPPHDEIDMRLLPPAADDPDRARIERRRQCREPRDKFAVQRRALADLAQEFPMLRDVLRAVATQEHAL